MMNKKDIESYKKAYTNLKKFATKYPEFKDILDVKGDFEKAKEIVRRLNRESSSIQTKNADLKKNFTALSKEFRRR